MSFYSKQSSNRFIVYSGYGLMSHLVVNNYGVTFSCCAKNDGKQVYAYESKELALQNTDDFFNQVAEVQVISKIEREFFFT